MHNENSTQRMSMSSQPSAEIEEEFSLLMSMALDELLDSDEQADFDSYLATYPTLAEEWQDWQALDIQLSSTPSVAPPTEFMLNFEVRLLQYERRRRLWWGMAFGSMAVVLWVAVLVGVASLGAFVLFGQPAWLTQAVHSLAYVSASFGTWVTAVGTAFGSVMSTQQAASLAMVYMLMSIAMVASWIYFLRHSTRSVDVAASA
jgi:anti-sigma factor RsiW